MNNSSEQVSIISCSTMPRLVWASTASESMLASRTQTLPAIWIGGTTVDCFS